MVNQYINYDEGKDYNIIPVEGQEAGWDVRILTGDYVETTLRYGNIRMDGTEKDPEMKFDFKVTYSPINELNSDNGDLQTFAGDVLLSILQRAIKEDALVIEDVKQ